MSEQTSLTQFPRASSPPPIPEFNHMAFTLDQFRLRGKVAIVTGAGGRGNSIGRAYAVALANAGASVLVADLNGDGARKVAEEIKGSGGTALAVQVDITETASVKAMVDAAIKAFGG